MLSRKPTRSLRALLKASVNDWSTVYYRCNLAMAKRAGSSLTCTMSARTAIRHGVMRVSKMIVDVVLRRKRRADALPLARVGVILIRFPDIS